MLAECCVPRRFIFFIFIAACIWAFPGLAVAQTANVSSGASVTIGGQLFYDYTLTTAPTAKDADGNDISPNAFNISRAAVDVSGRLSDRVSFRITPDVVRDTGSSSSLNGSLTLRLLYGYAQFDLSQPTSRWKETFVRLGIHQTPLVDFEEQIYRYRFQGTVFAEREGALTLTDAGASFHTTFPGDYGDVHVGVYNGEGAFRAETNSQKSFQVRGTIRPFASSDGLGHGLRVTGFFDADHYLPNAARNRFVTNVTFEHPHVNLGFDYMRTSDQTSVNASQVDGQGWSMFVTPFVREKGHGLEGLIRFDRFVPNLKLSTRARQRTIAGVAYWFPHALPGAAAALLADYEELAFDGFPSNVPANATQRRVALHGLIQF